MAIIFETVDPSLRASAVAIELRGTRRSVAGSLLPQTALIIGQYDQSLIAGITDYVPVQVFTADEAGLKFGFGHEIHRQALWIFGLLGGFSDKVWVAPVPVPSTPTAASGTIIFATTATSSGTYYFSIGGDLISIGIPNGTTPTEAGDILVTAITANLNSSVSAVNASGTVTLTAKDAGIDGNKIRLVLNPAGETQRAQNPASMTAAVPGSGGYLTSGAGATDVHDVFFNSSEEDILGDRWYTQITGPYTDSTNIGYYKDSWDARIDPLVRRPFDSTFGYTTETYAQALAIPATINGKGVSPVWDARSYAPSYELAAAVVGLKMLSATFDPGRPFKTLSTGIPFDTSVGDLSVKKNDALFRAGMGYFKVPATDLVLGDMALSYRTSGTGAATEEWFDSVSMTRRQEIIYETQELFNSAPYDRAILAYDTTITSKDYVIKPKKVIADMSALVDNWSSQGWVKNPATIKASIAAEINATNNSRIDSEVTLDEAYALRIIGILEKFLF